MKQKCRDNVIELTILNNTDFDGEVYAKNNFYSVLQNIDLLVDRGLGLFKPFITYRCSGVHHYMLYPSHTSYWYNFTTTQRYSPSLTLENTTTRNAPVLYVNSKYTETQVLERIAKLALVHGCVDEYTKYYLSLIEKRTGVIKEIPELQGADLRYKIVQTGHYTTVMFLSPAASQIELCTEEVYRDLYLIENDMIIGVNENYLTELYLFKISIQKYRRWVLNRNKLNTIINAEIPYFHWLTMVLKMLAKGEHHPWMTRRYWRWVEHLGFIDSHKNPLKTRSAIRIANYVQDK